MNCPVIKESRIASLFHEIMNRNTGNLLVGEPGGAYGKDRHDDTAWTMNFDAIVHPCSYHFCARRICNKVSFKMDHY